MLSTCVATFYSQQSIWMKSMKGWVFLNTKNFRKLFFFFSANMVESYIQAKIFKRFVSSQIKIELQNSSIYIIFEPKQKKCQV